MLRRTVRGVTPELQVVAHALRRAPTAAEAVLWSALQGRRLRGLKFRFQHPVGTFVLDFYCPALRLVVEVDGAIHEDAAVAGKDRERQRYLENYGYRVIRFQNETVLKDLALVLDRILEAVSVQELHPAHRPPRLDSFSGSEDEEPIPRDEEQGRVSIPL